MNYHMYIYKRCLLMCICIYYLLFYRHAFFWVLLAGVTLFLGNVVEVALYDEKVNR